MWTVDVQKKWWMWSSLLNVLNLSSWKNKPEKIQAWPGFEHYILYMYFIKYIFCICEVISVMIILPFSNSEEVSLLCGGQECHSQAQCLDSKCSCNSGYQGDGVTCAGKYPLRIIVMKIWYVIHLKSNRHKTVVHDIRTYVHQASLY